MAKMMQREVTSTIVKLARMEIVEGEPVVIKLDDEVLVGNIPVDKAQRAMVKKLGTGVTVLAVEPQTEVYELSVEEFLKYATIKVSKAVPEEN